DRSAKAATRPAQGDHRRRGGPLHSQGSGEDTRQRGPLCQDLRSVAAQHHLQDRRVRDQQAGVTRAVTILASGRYARRSPWEVRMPRIVSLIASATEMVCALGFEDQLVGRSHECDFPESVKRLPVCTEPKFNVEGTSYQID